jgi:UDP-GlcNAc:undecaprenyl-phosphate/decaprenyl-phosphate GlcNAc-1-phosphate transferase
VAMLLGVAAALVLAWQLPFLGRLSLVHQDSRAVLVAAAVICLVGVLDDIFDLSPLAKFAGQVLAAGIAVAMGVKMLWIPLPGQTVSLDGTASVAITVFFIVLCSNAVNFVDGLDGLATGVVAIGAGAFFAYSYVLTVTQDLTRATTSSLITVAIAGACLGFLPHNFFPARMFMGDSGAMLLGLLLATSTISLTGQIDTSQLEDGTGRLLPTILPLVLPLAILALPFLDLVLAFIRRTYAGKWWFVADKQHLHHRLLERGHSQRRAVLLMYAWSALVSFGVIALGLVRSTNWQPAAVIGLLVIFAVLLLLVTLARPVPAKRPRPGETIQ